MGPSAAGTAAVPVAVIGLACRLPGADDVGQLWQLVQSGRCSVTEGRRGSGEAGGRVGGYLSDVEGFDARSFGMSPREAVRTDPRHRLLLETAWEAFEDAGLPAERLAGRDAAVIASGCLMSEYWDLLRETGLADMHGLFGAGMYGTAPGRISHFFDLRGPSLSLDATCAGGLVGVHLAVRALRSGEVDLALVGGANVMLRDEDSAGLEAGGVLSPTGRCRFGDRAADGYVRGEGAVAIVLKRLSDAVDDGDRVHAVVLGSAVTNDGRSGGSQMTPSPTGQEAVLRAAYRDAGVAPADVHYVEAHGTGTEVGDRVELSTLGRFFAAGRDPAAPCLVGSVKSNIGHTEAVAGLAGLLKTVLAIRHRAIPATLHVDAPNPVLSDGSLAVALAREPQPWPGGGRPLAGVSSFGLSGVDAHVVLAGAEEAPVAPARRRAAGDAVAIPLSAPYDAALRAVARRYADHVREAVDLRDVAYTAGHHRSHHPYRAVVVGSDRQRIADALRAWADGCPVADVVTGRVPPRTPKVVFLFPGQGTQWPGMGAWLLDRAPVFAATMRACDAAVRRELGWSVIDALTARDELVGVDRVQPALWALQVSLAALWREWGVEPDEVIGHSMGEIAAATVGGALSIDAAATVCCRRAEVVRRLAGPGVMAVVRMPEDAARAAIAPFGDRLAIGVVNSRSSTVLSGDADAMDELLGRLEGAGVSCRRVSVDYASHSPRMSGLGSPLREALADLRPRACSVPMRSTALDRIVDGAELTADYWVTNLSDTVRFARAMRAALDGTRDTVFLELSPHPTLVDAVEDEVDASAASATVLASLRRDDDNALLTTAGCLHTRGVPLRWDRVSPDGRFDPLPGYPWQRERCWVPDHNGDVVIEDDDGDVADATAGALTVVTREDRVDPSTVSDFAAHVDVALATACEAARCADVVVTGLRIARPRDARSAVTGTQDRRVLVREAGPGEWAVDVHVKRAASGAVARWSVALSASVRGGAADEQAALSVPTIRRWCREAVDVARLAAILPGEVEPVGDCVREAWRRDGEALVRAEPLATGSDGSPGWSPSQLLAVCAAAVAAAQPADGPTARRVQVGRLGEARLTGSRISTLSTVWCHARLDALGRRDTTASVRVADESGAVVARLHGFRLHAAAVVPGRQRAAADGPSTGERAARLTAAPPAAAPAGDAADVEAYLVDRLAGILHVTPRDIDASTSFVALGLDSLLAGELRTRIARDFGTDLPTRQLLDGSDVTAVARRIRERLARSA